MSRKKHNFLYPDQNIIKTNYETEMKKSYIDYAMNVLVSRALPDARDGFKPVHRRILYAMNELYLYPDKPHRKSARIVGDTMGKYHPHGDFSIYDAMVRMSQDFATNHPLIDGHGNFGNIDGDSAAAMRYTEARLQPISMDILDDLNMDVVDYQANFDESLKEPMVLPTKFPSLLINGSSGIAVGMSTNIPPHNLREVINAAIAYIKDENIVNSKLLRYIKGPDFPTGGIIVNKKDIKNIYNKGSGRLILRSNIETEIINKNKVKLVVTEIPYTFSGRKTNLVERIYDLMSKKKLDEIINMQDESSKDGLRIVMELRKGADPERVKEKLYDRTPLQESFSANMLALFDQAPVNFTLREYLAEFTKFQREMYLRKYNFNKNKLEKRKEVLEGFLMAYSNMDIIIEALRGSKKLSTVKDCLMFGKTADISFKLKKSEKIAQTFRYTPNQATAILDMKLHKLISIEEESLKVELKSVNKELAVIIGKIENQRLLDQDIIKYLTEFSKKYGKPRQTAIEDVKIVPYKEKVQVEDVYIAIDKLGYLKSFDSTTYERNKEVIVSENRFICKSTNLSNVIIITENGNSHQLKTSLIPKCRVSDKGVQIASLVDYKNDFSIEMFESFDPKENYFFITKQGLIKQVKGSELVSSRKTVFASKLRDDDKLLAVLKDSKDQSIRLNTSESRSLNLPKSEFVQQSKSGSGVRGIKLKKGEYVTEVMANNSNSKQKRGAAPRKIT